MAAFYRGQLHRVQPTGPYLLAGWSMGGLVALEMAQQLRAANQEISLLAMFDTYLAVPDAIEFDPGDHSRMWWIASKLSLPASELEDRPLAEQWTRIAARAQQTAGDGALEIYRLAVTCAAHLRAIERYQLRPYPGCVVLFQAGARRIDPGGEWHSFFPRLRVEVVPGNHYTIFQRPQVDFLAGRLSRYLAEALDENCWVRER
jgi:thioesterase domain-containing protein